jgi:hypothetical protein
MIYHIIHCEHSASNTMKMVSSKLSLQLQNMNFKGWTNLSSKKQVVILLVSAYFDHKLDLWFQHA